MVLKSRHYVFFGRSQSCVEEKLSTRQFFVLNYQMNVKFDIQETFETSRRPVNLAELTEGEALGMLIFLLTPFFPSTVSLEL